MLGEKEFENIAIQGGSRREHSASLAREILIYFLPPINIILISLDSSIS